VMSFTQNATNNDFFSHYKYHPTHHSSHLTNIPNSLISQNIYPNIQKNS
jgi:hypothetical protein